MRAYHRNTDTVDGQHPFQENQLGGGLFQLSEGVSHPNLCLMWILSIHRAVPRKNMVPIAHIWGTRKIIRSDSGPECSQPQNIWLWVKSRYPKWTPVNGTKDSNLPSPGFILTQTPDKIPCKPHPKRDHQKNRHPHTWPTPKYLKSWSDLGFPGWFLWVFFRPFRASASPPWRGCAPTPIGTPSPGAAPSTVDGCEICSHHFETMVEAIVCWYLQGNHSFQGFLGGAGLCPSTILTPPHMPDQCLRSTRNHPRSLFGTLKSVQDWDPCLKTIAGNNSIREDLADCL